jgi:F-type H+-transporting ATPase subunit beta
MSIMQKYDSLKNIIAIVGENELSPADRQDYQSAKKLVDFFSQDFAVAEHLSGRPGQYFTLEQTLDGVEEIINGGGETKAEEKPEEKTEDKAEDKETVETADAKK